ncbi:MAG: macro domain-containing protein [Anaerolineales bacterium]
MNTVVAEYALEGKRLLRLVQGDLTQEAVDAIVNAANAQLAHGGGVAGAIVSRGGWEIQEESDAWVRDHGPVTHDRPAITGGGRLPCRFVIHAVGPVWGVGEEDAKLAAAVRGALQAADEHHLSRVALPAISTGVFAFPRERAAGVIVAAIADYLQENADSGLQEVRITVLDHAGVRVFSEALRRRLGPGAPGR